MGITISEQNIALITRSVRANILFGYLDHLDRDQEEIPLALICP